MRVIPCLLMLTLSLAAPVMAQPTSDQDSADCKTQAAAVELDMDIARSKDQMLRRRQLAGVLAALEARCDPVPTKQSRAAKVQRLEQEIIDLRTELHQAEEQLRRLKSEAG